MVRGRAVPSGIVDEAGRSTIGLEVLSQSPDAIQIRYSVPRNSQFSLEVFDVGGRRVSSLADGRGVTEGTVVEWDFRGKSGRRIPGGIYYLQLRTDHSESTAKICVVW